MATCDTCKQELAKEDCLIIWEDTMDDLITDLRFVHKGRCDDKRFSCSGGSAWGREWSPEWEHGRFFGSRFQRSTTRDHALDVLSEWLPARVPHT